MSWMLAGVWAANKAAELVGDRNEPGAVDFDLTAKNDSVISVAGGASYYQMTAEEVNRISNGGTFNIKYKIDLGAGAAMTFVSPVAFTDMGNGMHSASVTAINNGVIIVGFLLYGNQLVCNLAVIPTT